MTGDVFEVQPAQLDGATLAAGRGAPATRAGPRPLPIYLSLAGLLAQLPQLECLWSNGDAPSPLPGRDRPGSVDPERFLRGLHAYWRHPYRRDLAPPPTIWQDGSASLLDYGQEGGTPLLVVPSLINRAYILDLLEERSFLRHLAANGFRPFLLDWGHPQGGELALTMADQAEARAQAALDAVLEATSQPPVVLGYCMGGLLACALAQARQADLAGLALLATPWDFHAGPSIAPLLLTSGLLPLTSTIGALGYASVELLQTFFALLNPLQVIVKFQRFASLAADAPQAPLFVAVEDWLNDGVPLAGPVAQECLWHWYGANLPGRGLWTVGGRLVQPERLELPAFVAIPARDRIVPAASAEALAARLPAPTVIRPAAGHVSMIVGEGAREQLWQPLTGWLRRIAPRRAAPTVRPASTIA